MKSESKHTPSFTQGPWYADGGSVFVDTRRQVCCGRPGEECCGCPDVEGDYFEVAQTSEKDARLIAAAPELLEALEQAVSGLADYRNTLSRESPSFAEIIARSLISRVRGE